MLTHRAALAALIDAGLTRDEIAARAGCSVDTLRRAARRFGLPPSTPGRKPTRALAHRDTLASMIASGLSTAEIAAQVGRSTNVVRGWITRHALDYPQHRRWPIHPPQLDDADWLRREHHDRGRSLGDIARGFGRGRTLVASRFRDFGIPIQPQTTYLLLLGAACSCGVVGCGDDYRRSFGDDGFPSAIANAGGDAEGSWRILLHDYGIADGDIDTSKLHYQND